MQTGVETLQPWLEEELCRLYINPQLEALEQFTDNFVMVSYFIDSYQRVRIRLVQYVSSCNEIHEEE